MVDALAAPEALRLIFRAAAWAAPALSCACHRSVGSCARSRRRAHRVRMRASAMNRNFGLLTQGGTRLSLDRLRNLTA